eukprot:TRINITY_DN33572_c0_g2_i2.p1 TRINITY_DN33572_c0_g2~~TRINITY_DN33572_c0_g2_i2.p1  ORF type:complete len:195 (-),score=36.55 TRINITY_DN33572_c0_g2_i2:282-866(-)
MVIPIPNSPALVGPPPASVAHQFRRIKISVQVMIVATLVRVFLGSWLRDPIYALSSSANLIINTVIGVFLLRDDADISKVHRFLVTTCCQSCHQQCDGSMRCLMPFVLCNLITVVMDLLGGGSLQIIITGLPIVFEPEKWPSVAFGIVFSGFVLSCLAGFFGQLAGALFGYYAFKEITDMESGGYGMLGGEPEV